MSVADADDDRISEAIEHSNTAGISGSIARHTAQKGTGRRIAPDTTHTDDNKRGDAGQLTSAWSATQDFMMSTVPVTSGTPG